MEGKAEVGFESPWGITASFGFAIIVIVRGLCPNLPSPVALAPCCRAAKCPATVCSGHEHACSVQILLHGVPLGVDAAGRESGTGTM